MGREFLITNKKMVTKYDYRWKVKLDLGRYLSKCRIKDNLCLEETAKKIGVNPYTLELWETGRAFPQKSRLESITNAIPSLDKKALNLLYAGNYESFEELVDREKP